MNANINLFGFDFPWLATKNGRMGRAKREVQ